MGGKMKKEKLTKEEQEAKDDEILFTEAMKRKNHCHI